MGPAEPALHSDRGGFLDSRNRQVNMKGGASSELARHAEVAAALLDDAVDDRQAESGAFALLFCRKKRFEELRARLLTHASAGIGYCEPRMPPRMSLGERDGRSLVDVHLF